ncbi:hypothetical protein FBY35_2124 [Streptomyces sp. SLBN-118]|nr:hypothetical protein FBY35_2124 [Streptomyces sp. SLBN-118]
MRTRRQPWAHTPLRAVSAILVCAATLLADSSAWPACPRGRRAGAPESDVPVCFPAHRGRSAHRGHEGRPTGYSQRRPQMPAFKVTAVAGRQERGHGSAGARQRHAGERGHRGRDGAHAGGTAQRRAAPHDRQDRPARATRRLRGDGGRSAPAQPSGRSSATPGRGSPRSCNVRRPPRADSRWPGQRRPQRGLRQAGECTPSELGGLPRCVACRGRVRSIQRCAGPRALWRAAGRDCCRAPA